MLRRSLLLWGLGHLALGDPRGWLLVAAEIAAAAALVGGLVTLGATNAAGWLFIGLVAFFAAWGAQAVAAYRRAVALGGRPGGAVGILGLAPAAVIVFTGYWLLAGSAGSPAATLQRYVSAWRDDRPELAAALFQAPREPAAVKLEWRAQEAYLRSRLLELTATLGPASGLDPDRPFAALVFDFPEAAGPSGEPPGPLRPGTTSRAVVEIIRRETVRESFFGLVPTAAQRTVIVERIGEVVLRAESPLTAVSGALVWELESVCLGPEGCPP